MDTTFFDLFDTFGPLISFVFSDQQRNIKFVGKHPMNYPTKFGSNGFSGFREEG